MAMEAAMLIVSMNHLCANIIFGMPISFSFGEEGAEKIQQTISSIALQHLWISSFNRSPDLSGVQVNMS